MKNSRINDEFINSLIKTYRFRAEASIENCPMQSIAIPFAAQELDPDEQEKFRDHLHTCSFCLDLVIDIKAAESESRATTGQSLSVLPALSQALGTSSDASRTNAKAGKLKHWFARFLTSMLSPKLVSTAAVACLAFIVIHFTLQDPDVGRQQDKIQKQSSLPETRVKPTDDSEADVPSGGNTASGERDSRREPLSSTGKLDPFKPLFKNDTRVGDSRKMRKKRVPRTPLERIALSQLKLVAIILSEKGNTALMEERNGKGWVVKEGTYIGINSGKIIEISKGKIVIEEQINDITGKNIKRKIELKLENR